MASRATDAQDASTRSRASVRLSSPAAGSAAATRRADAAAAAGVAKTADAVRRLRRFSLSPPSPNAEK